MQELYALLDKVSAVGLDGARSRARTAPARSWSRARSTITRARASSAFVVTNCSAFNDNLLDSELFGHKRGAFTGAVADKPGLFEIADLGTFFLDEIGDMSPTLQVKVLRVLQEGTFNRVGDTETRKVDVRIIAATNRDLDDGRATASSARTSTTASTSSTCTLPAAARARATTSRSWSTTSSARHRRNGAPKRLAPRCLAQMLAYPWPGNVRELENEIERLVVLAGDATGIDAALLSPRIRQDAARSREAPASLPAGGDRGARAQDDRRGDAPARRQQDPRRRGAQGLARNLIRLVQKYRISSSGRSR